MRTLTPPDDVRFYARVLSATLECPRCGALLAFRPAGSGGSQTRGCQWNRRTNRLTCHACQLTYQLGLLAWPVGQGGGLTPTPPRDQVPHERQLSQLRGWGGTWLSDRVKAKRASHTNITARCTCRDKHITHQACPLHPEGIENW